MNHLKIKTENIKSIVDIEEKVRNDMAKIVKKPNIPNRPSGIFFGAAGAAKTPKIGDFRPAQKPCIENPSVLNRAFRFANGPSPRKEVGETGLLNVAALWMAIK